MKVFYSHVIMPTDLPEAYLENCQTSKMKRFAEKI